MRKLEELTRPDKPVINKIVLNIIYNWMIFSNKFFQYF